MGRPKGSWSGANNPRWNGGIYNGPSSYRSIKILGHSRGSGTHGYVREHVLVVERVIGAPLSKTLPIHHIDGNKRNNSPDNLAICLTTLGHQTIHRRERALAACGHPDWVKCWICKQWDSPNNLRSHKPGGARSRDEHGACHAAYERERKIRLAKAKFTELVASSQTAPKINSTGVRL